MLKLHPPKTIVKIKTIMIINNKRPDNKEFITLPASVPDADGLPPAKQIKCDKESPTRQQSTIIIQTPNSPIEPASIAVFVYVFVVSSAYFGLAYMALILTFIFAVLNYRTAHQHIV